MMSQRHFSNGEPIVPTHLNLTDEDLSDLLAHPPTANDQPEIDRLRATLIADMGGGELMEGWQFDPARQWLHAWALLATLPNVRAYHASRGIPENVSWATFADLGRFAALDRNLHGSGGLRRGWWLTVHFRGALYRLGRLQFHRTRSPEGEFLLKIHIPDGGPFTPESCDASFARAGEFFNRYFPEEPVAAAMCSSWLLDPALSEYLPPESNIVRFQRRFELVDEGPEDDSRVLRFVFGQLDPNLDSLPQRTTLERAIVTHLRAGRHWRWATGTLQSPRFPSV